MSDLESGHRDELDDAEFAVGELGILQRLEIVEELFRLGGADQHRGHREHQFRKRRPSGSGASQPHVVQRQRQRTGVVEQVPVQV